MRLLALLAIALLLGSCGEWPQDGAKHHKSEDGSDANRHEQVSETPKAESEHGLVIATVCLVVATVALVIATGFLAYFTKQLKNVSETQAAALQGTDDKIGSMLEAIKRSVETAIASTEVADRAAGAAEKAAAQTQRSVDAYVDAERGRLVYDHEEWGPFGYTLKVWFRNVGRSPVVVRMFDALYQPDLPNTPLRAIKPGTVRELHHVILPGEYFIGGRTKEIDGCHDHTFIPIPEDVSAKHEQHMTFARFSILYDSVPAKVFLLTQACAFGAFLKPPQNYILVPVEIEVPNTYLAAAKKQRDNDTFDYQRG